MVTAGQSAPGGGTFEHFSVESLPIVAPLNARGQVAFFASLLRGAGGEGLFLASGSGITKVTVEGDPVPGRRHDLRAGTTSRPGAQRRWHGGLRGQRGQGQDGGRHLHRIARPDPGRGARRCGGARHCLGHARRLRRPGAERPRRRRVHWRPSGAAARRSRPSTIVPRAGIAPRARSPSWSPRGTPRPPGASSPASGPPLSTTRERWPSPRSIEGRAVPGGIFRVRARPAQDARRRRGRHAARRDLHEVLRAHRPSTTRGSSRSTRCCGTRPVEAAVFAVDNDVVRKVVATGDAAPGGGTFSHFGPWPALNAAGTVGFVASVDGGPSPVGAFHGRQRRPLEDRGHRGSAARRRARSPRSRCSPWSASSPSGSLTFAAAPDGDGAGRRGGLPRDAVPLIRVADPATASVHVVGRVLDEDVGRGDEPVRRRRQRRAPARPGACAGRAGSTL